MDITVTFRHTEPTEALKNYAREKVSKIKKYVDSPVEAHIVLGVEKIRHVADVTIRVNGTLFKGVEETGDLYSAIDIVMDKIDKQVRRYLSKNRNHRSEGAKGDNPVVYEDAYENIQDGPVVEIEKMNAKPMDEEEAVLQLNLSKQDFIVFRNAKTREVNVIYKRGDGNFGLIDPAG